MYGIYISHSANTLGKGINQTILIPAMGKYLGRLGSLILVRQPDEDKENRIQTVRRPEEECAPPGYSSTGHAKWVAPPSDYGTSEVKYKHIFGATILRSQGTGASYFFKVLLLRGPLRKNGFLFRNSRPHIFKESARKLSSCKRGVLQHRPEAVRG